MKNILDKSCIETLNIHFMFNNVIFQKSAFYDDAAKYCTGGQATEDNMEQAHCMLNN
jgi:hypothetical protein